MRYEDGALYLDVKLYKENPQIDISLFSDDTNFDFTIESSGSGGLLPYYEGSYVVEPRKVGQELETAHKSMHENVVINQIYYSQVHNPSGGDTVFIGQE